MDNREGDPGHESEVEGEPSDDTVPVWWEENVAIREELDIPGYDAPRFEDGQYVHEVLDEMEAVHEGQIRLVNPEPSTRRDWEIRLNGEPVATVQRTRDTDANTVFRMRAVEFRDVIETASANQNSDD